jgi:hypothetical protein
VTAEATQRVGPETRPEAFEWRHPFGPGVSAEGYFGEKRVASVGIRPDDGTGAWWGVCLRSNEPEDGGWLVRRRFSTCAAATAYVEQRLLDVLRLVGVTGVASGR